MKNIKEPMEKDRAKKKNIKSDELEADFRKGNSGSV
jgi:hypothetical protein